MERSGDAFASAAALPLLLPTNVGAIAGAFVVGCTVTVLLMAIYNYFLHPIAHIKGPLLACISPVWLVRSVAGHKLNPDIEALHRKYGPVVRVGPNELSFASEDSVKQIHNLQFKKFTKKGTSEELIFKLVFAAPNLLTVQDPTAHKNLRDTLLPAFTNKALLEQQDITQHHVNLMIERLLEAVKSSPTISLTHTLDKMIWGIVGDLCFGEPVSEKQWEHHEQMKANHVKAAPALEFFQYLTELPVFGTLARFAVTMVKKTVDPTKNVLGEHQFRGHVTRQEGRRDFLTAIMGSKSAAGLSQAEIFSNMLLLLMGGYDSTSVTLSAYFHHMLKNPHYYKTLQAQLRQTYASAGDIDCNSLMRQPLLNACLNEALRLVPAINGHGSHRMAAKSTTVEGVFVPAGTLVSADPYTVHRHPDYWAFPHEFRPERWLPESSGPGSPYEKDNKRAWLPFLVGPRVCIGREMALQTLRLAVAKIVYNFDLSLENAAFEWDRDAGSHFVWHDFDVQVKVVPSV